MNVHMPPGPLPPRRMLFLAGSIEQGSADDWQTRLTDALHDVPGDALNPRRQAWDSSWRQSLDEPRFRGQVEWELTGIETSELVAMYFAPNTKSPITLLELGIVAATTPSKLIVCCPEGFWRNGNVEIVCHRYGATLVTDWQPFVDAVRRRIWQLGPT